MGDHVERYRVAERQLWVRYGLAPDEHWVSLPPTGARIRVLETGEGPAVLFSHGVLIAGSEFAPLVGGLAGLRCILVDLPGSGLSDAISPDVPPTAFVDLLERVLDDLDLDCVAVVGHSFGGACALWLAAARPERVRRLILEGCPALLEGARPSVPLRLLASGAVGRFLARRRRLFRDPRLMLRTMGHGAGVRAGRIDREWLDWYRSLALHTATMSGGSTLLQQVAAGGGFRRELTFKREVLASISQPTLFLWGEDDPLAGVDVGRRAAAAMPHATLRSFAESGHLPWLDDPAEHARLVREFVSAEP